MKIARIQIKEISIKTINSYSFFFISKVETCIENKKNGFFLYFSKLKLQYEYLKCSRIKNMFLLKGNIRY